MTREASCWASSYPVQVAALQGRLLPQVQALPLLVGCRALLALGSWGRGFVPRPGCGSLEAHISLAERYLVLMSGGGENSEIKV